MLPIDPTQLKFNWPTARACCELSDAAYGRNPDFFPGKSGVHWIEKKETDTEVLIHERKDCLVVSNRGSSSIPDFIQDAKIFRRHPRSTLTWDKWFDPECEVHCGILENVSSVIEELVETVRNLGGETKPVFVMGHSKGGGEAILEALELKRQKINVASVYTFGGLRIFNAAGAALYDSELRDITFRVVNENDIVPRIPIALTGYRHVGNEIFLPCPIGWSMNPPLWTKILSDALGLYGAYRHGRDVLIRDHILGGDAGYLQRIQLLK